MNIDKLRDRFPNEKECHILFESIIRQNGRKCPDCGDLSSCQLNGASVRTGVYDCYRCKRQFTVITKTPMHKYKTTSMEMVAGHVRRKKTTKTIKTNDKIVVVQT